MIDYPVYTCHKKVQAARITAVAIRGDGDMALQLEGFDPLVVPAEEAARKPVPSAGWFLVRYDNGYTSFSPAAIFLDGYRPA